MLLIQRRRRAGVWVARRGVVGYVAGRWYLPSINHLAMPPRLCLPCLPTSVCVSPTPCNRECFARMNVMDPHLRLRLAEWLAYHLSNFEYIWPWDRWSHVLQAPPYDGQR